MAEKTSYQRLVEKLRAAEQRADLAKAERDEAYRVIEDSEIASVFIKALAKPNRQNARADILLGALLNPDRSDSLVRTIKSNRR